MLPDASMIIWPSLCSRPISTPSLMWEMRIRLDNDGASLSCLFWPLRWFSMKYWGFLILPMS